MFEITTKGRAFIDDANRPRGGNAPWVRAKPVATPAAASPLSTAV
jgi:hypothetical protein